MNQGVFQRYFLDGWRPYAWISALIAIIYFKTIWYGFTSLDDNVLILNNMAFLKDLSNIPDAFFRKVFPNSYLAYYRPVLTISFMLDAQIGGLSLIWYHITNILLHMAASCLLFVFLNRMVYDKEVSFLFTLIFAVHPVLSQAVAWIPGRNDTLLAVFTLASFIAFTNYLKSGRMVWYISHIAFFALALFSKETALVLTPICILYIYVIARDKQAYSKTGAFALGWAVVIIVWAHLRAQAINGTNNMNYYEMTSIIFSYIPAAIQFLGKIFFPFNLSVFPIIPDTTLVYGMAALFIVIAALTSTKKIRVNFVIFGMAWALFFLAPSLIRASAKLMADFLEHRVYLPMVGCIIVLFETDAVRRLGAHKTAMRISAVIVIFLFSVLTFVHIDNFKDRFAFWKSAIATSPRSSFAHLALAGAYQDNGMTDEAFEEYRKCLKLDSQESRAFHGIGSIYLAKGVPDEAEKYFKKAIAAYPYSDNSYLSLGVIYYKKGELNKAERSWTKAVLVNPNNADAYKNLTIYYSEQKEYDKARECARQLRRMGVNVPEEFLKSIGMKQAE